MLRNYWRCLPRWSGHSLHVKTIVNTQHANMSKGCVGSFKAAPRRSDSCRCPTVPFNRNLRKGWVARDLLPLPTALLTIAAAVWLHVLMMRRPHSWWFKEPYYAINEQFERFDHVVLPPERGTINKIALFHYVVKYAVRHGLNTYACVSGSEELTWNAPPTEQHPSPCYWHMSSCHWVEISPAVPHVSDRTSKWLAHSDVRMSCTRLRHVGRSRCLTEASGLACTMLRTACGHRNRSAASRSLEDFKYKSIRGGGSGTCHEARTARLRPLIASCRRTFACI